MKRNTMKARLMGALICLALIFSGTMAWAVNTYSLSLQTTNGTAVCNTFLRGQDLYLYININDMTGVAGAAFTLTYPSEVLEFEGTDLNGESNGIYSPVFTFVQDTATTKTHRGNATAGKIMLSGAAIDTTKGGSAYTGAATLFEIRFKVKVNAAISNFGFSLGKTILNNTAAGYASTGEIIPVLVGAVPCSDTAWLTLVNAFPDLTGGMTPLPATATFSVIEGALPNDTIPDQFTFTVQTNVALSTVVMSNTITVSGINEAASISITGGTYSINGGVYTSSSGTVNNGNTVTVRQTSSGSYSTTTNATLTIGGVSDTFTVKTVTDPQKINTGLPWLHLLLGD